MGTKNNTQVRRRVSVIMGTKNSTYSHVALHLLWVLKLTPANHWYNSCSGDKISTHVWRVIADMVWVGFRSFQEGLRELLGSVGVTNIVADIMSTRDVSP